MDKKRAFEQIFGKFEKILPHLGNDNDGEALNAVRSLTNVLKKADLDWHDVLTLMRPQEDAVLEMLKRLLEKETDTLVRLARARATLFYSTKRAAFADVMIGNNILTLPLKSSEFSDWLLGQFFKETQKAPKLASERDAIRTLSALSLGMKGPGVKSPCAPPRLMESSTSTSVTKLGELSRSNRTAGG